MRLPRSLRSLAMTEFPNGSGGALPTFQTMIGTVGSAWSPQSQFLVHHELRLLVAVAPQLVAELRPAASEDRDREKRRVDCPRLADRECRDGNPGGHLDDRE